MTKFTDLGLSPEILEVLKQKGFEEPTPIQALTIPHILTKPTDVVAQAQTGTGKTAAFGLPIIQQLKDNAGHVQVLVLAPTRELAIQVAEELYSFKGKRRLNIVPVFGGQSIQIQLQNLRRGADIVVGTPGRVLDHLKRKTLKLDQISFLVLDEADEMLNMGFLEDVTTIMETTAKDKKTFLFSATMPREILNISKKYMHEHEIFKVQQGSLEASKTDQIYFEVSEGNKFEALCRIIDMEEDFYGVVFCRTKVDTDKVARHLRERGYAADALHGDIAQNLREKILNQFKKKTITILVATDVAARGIDVKDISHVINYSLPQDSESYIHRIGRTARAGKEGNAITFVSPEEYRKLQFIQRKTKTDIRRGSLPKVSDIIETKRRQIFEKISEMNAAEPKAEYTKLAQELLESNQPEALLANLLGFAFKGHLDEGSYAEIDTRVVDRKGTTRLFVTQGKQDGLTVKSLLSVISEKCKIKENQVRDIKILESFSFVTLPFAEAEIVLNYFQNTKRGKGMFITKAKKDRQSGGRSSRDRSPRERRPMRSRR